MKSEWTPVVVMQFAVALALLVGVFVLVALFFFVEPPKENQQVLFTITGALLTVGFANVVGFLFGQKEQSEQAQKIAEATSGSPTASQPVVDAVKANTSQIVDAVESAKT